MSSRDGGKCKSHMYLQDQSAVARNENTILVDYRLSFRKQTNGTENLDDAYQASHSRETALPTIRGTSRDVLTPRATPNPREDAQLEVSSVPKELSSRFPGVTKDTDYAFLGSSIEGWKNLEPRSKAHCKDSVLERKILFQKFCTQLRVLAEKKCLEDEVGDEKHSCTRVSCKCRDKYLEVIEKLCERELKKFGCRANHKDDPSQSCQKEGIHVNPAKQLQRDNLSYALQELPDLTTSNELSVVAGNETKNQTSQRGNTQERSRRIQLPSLLPGTGSFRSTDSVLPFISASKGQQVGWKEPRKHRRCPTNTEHVMKKKQKNVEFSGSLDFVLTPAAADQRLAPAIKLEPEVIPKSYHPQETSHRLHQKLNRRSLTNEIILQNNTLEEQKPLTKRNPSSKRLQKVAEKNTKPFSHVTSENEVYWKMYSNRMGLPKVFPYDGDSRDSVVPLVEPVEVKPIRLHAPDETDGHLFARILKVKASRKRVPNSGRSLKMSTLARKDEHPKPTLLGIDDVPSFVLVEDGPLSPRIILTEDCSEPNTVSNASYTIPLESHPDVMKELSSISLPPKLPAYLNPSKDHLNNVHDNMTTPMKDANAEELVKFKREILANKRRVLLAQLEVKKRKELNKKCKPFLERHRENGISKREEKADQRVLSPSLVPDFSILSEDQEQWYHAVYSSFLEGRYASEKELLTLHELIDGLEIINKGLISDGTLRYVLSILEILKSDDDEGVDFRTFAIMAAFSEKVSALSEFSNFAFDVMDYQALAKSFLQARQLFDAICDEKERNISQEQLEVELRAGEVAEPVIQSVKKHMNGRDSLEFLDFLVYFPLFVQTHTNIMSEPLLFKNKEA